MHASISARLPATLAAVAVVGAGLGVRAIAGGAFGKYAGVALYATLIYTLVVCAAPRTRPMAAGAIALGISWTVEFAQLTPIPAQWSARSSLARLALGSTFNPQDLAWYAVGVALAVAARVLLRHARLPFTSTDRSHPASRQQ